MKYTTILFLLCLLFGCQTYQATDFTYARPVDTTTKPIEKQEKKTYLVNGVYADNQFKGARLNDFTLLAGDTLQATIRPENVPINMSPWYAFKLWSEEARTLPLVLHYEHGQHRYEPVISRDGQNWMPLDSNLVSARDSTDALLQLSIGPDTLWLAAQEIASTDQVRVWCETVAEHPAVAFQSIGKSALNRDLFFLDIGEGEHRKKEVIAVISRQHPPEVTGYFAMQAFIEAILEDHPLANAFRKKYRLLVYPLLNPDGADLGHWRHNAGGVDLNRDWAFYHQPEIRQIADHMVKTVRQDKADLILGLDFHSTWYDIYYTNARAPEFIQGFKDYWIFGIQNAIQEEATERPSKPESPVSKNWFFNQFGAEGITYEIGDATPRDFIREKGRVSALEMMGLLIYR